MNAARLLGAEASVAIVGVTASDLLGQDTADRTLPKPRRLLAVLTFYSILSLASSFGNGPARLAAAAGGVTALASLVIGSTGKTFVKLIDQATGLLTSAGAGGSSSSASGSPSGGDTQPGYHSVPGPGGTYQVPNDPNQGRDIPPGAKRTASRIRSTPTGSVV